MTILPSTLQARPEVDLGTPTDTMPDPSDRHRYFAAAALTGGHAVHRPVNLAVAA
jgi:hypothetical protein